MTRIRKTKKQYFLFLECDNGECKIWEIFSYEVECSFGRGESIQHKINANKTLDREALSKGWTHPKKGYDYCPDCSQR